MNNDSLKRHEVVHTASIVMDMFDRHILEHEATIADPEIAAAAQAAFDALFVFYQRSAQRFSGLDETPL